jgi:hypothetical protein
MKLGWLIFTLVFLISIAGVSASVLNVTNCTDLNTAVNGANTIYILNDINCAGVTWTTPTGIPTRIYGNNFTISNIFANNTGTNGGIFSTDGGYGFYAERFCIDNATVDGEIYVGAFWGYNGDVATHQINQVCIKNSHFRAYGSNGASAVGPFYGFWDGSSSGYINNSYTWNNTISADPALDNTNYCGLGGFAGKGLYLSIIVNSYAWGNTISGDPDSVDYMGGFIGNNKGSGGTYYNLLSILPIIQNATYLDHTFWGNYVSSSYNGLWYSNDGGRNDPIAWGNSSTLFNISTTAPLSAWDFTSVWKLGNNYPIFIWQTEAPPPSSYSAPIYEYMIQNASEICYWDCVIDLSTAYYAPNYPSINMSHVTMTVWNSTNHSQLNSTSNCVVGYEYNCSLANTFGSFGKAPGIYRWETYAIDTLGNRTDAPSYMYFNISEPVVDNPPQWYNYTQNQTTIPYGVTGYNYMMANFTDDNYLVPESSKLYINFSNGTAWQALVYGTDIGFTCNANNTDCKVEYGFSSKNKFPYTEPGTYIWAYRMWDNATPTNQSNTTPWSTFTITAEPMPQWYNYTGPATVQLGTTASVSINWTDNVNLSAWLVSTTNTSGVWFNSSFYTTWTTCAVPKRDCKLLASIGTPTPGVMQWKFYVNDSANAFNISPAISFNVVDTTPPQYLLGHINISGIKPIGTPFVAYYNWTDNYKLNYYIASWWNTTAWQNTSAGLFSAGSNCGFGVSYNCSGISGTLANLGVWEFKFYVNDSITGNWNVSPILNITVGVDQPPQVTGHSQNVSSLEIGDSILLVGNFTDDLALSGYYLVEGLNSSHYWCNGAVRTNYALCINDFATTWSNCSSVKSCGIAIEGTPNPIGTHNWSIFANDSLNQWNNTGWQTWEVFYVLPDASFYSATTPVHTLGWDTSIVGSGKLDGFTALGIPYYSETGDTGLSAGIKYPITYSLNSYTDLTFILDSYFMKVFNGSTLDNIGTYSISGNSFANPILVENYPAGGTADYMAVSQDTNGVFLNELRINTGSGVMTNYSTNISSYFPNYAGGEIRVGCGADDCLFAYNLKNYTGYNESYAPNTSNALMGIFMNESNHFSSPFVIYNSSENTEIGTYGSCFSRWENIKYADYDGDGINEYILGFTTATEHAVWVWDFFPITGHYIYREEGHIAVINVSNVGVVERILNNSIPGHMALVGSDYKLYCSDNVAQAMSNVIVSNMDTNASTLEFSYGVTNTDYSDEFQDFQLYTDWYNGTSVQYGEATDLQGNLSNVFLSAQFNNVSGNNRYDLCGVGWNAKNDIPLLADDFYYQGIICGTSYGGHNEQYWWNWNNESPRNCVKASDFSYDTFDMLVTSGKFHHVWHKTISPTYHIETDDLMWGDIVFNKDNGGIETDGGDFTGGIFCSDIILITPPFTYPFMSMPVRKAYSYDKLFFNPNGIKYEDDNYVNDKPIVRNYSINPCITFDWKSTTAAEVMVTFDDNNSVVGYGGWNEITSPPLEWSMQPNYWDMPQDNISFKLILFADQPYEIDSGWSPWFKSPTYYFNASEPYINYTNSWSVFMDLVGTNLKLVNFSSNWSVYNGPANITANKPNETMVLRVRDDANGVYNDYNITFSVGNTTGDVVEYGECVSIMGGAGITPSTTPTTTDSAPDFIADIIDDAQDRFGISATILWLLLIVFISVVIFIKGGENKALSGGAIIMVDIVLIFLGLRWGFLGVGIVVLLGLAGGVIAFIFLKDKLLGVKS